MNKIHSNNGISPSVAGNSKHLKDDGEKVDVLNNTFSSAHYLKRSRMTCVYYMRIWSTFQSSSRQEYVKYLWGIDIFKSAHLDKINPNVLKELSEEVSGFLMIIDLNKSWISGKFQKKSCEIILLLKRGNWILAWRQSWTHYWTSWYRGEFIRKGQDRNRIALRIKTNLISFFDKITSLVDKDSCIEITAFR